MLPFLVQTILNGAHMHCCTFGSFADSGETNPPKNGAWGCQESQAIEVAYELRSGAFTASFEEIELSNAKKFRNQLN